MNWTRKQTAIATVLILISIFGIWMFAQAVIVQPFPNILRFKVKEPLFDLRGPTIVFDQAYETSIGSATTFAILVENGDGPISGQISFTANVTGWTEDPSLVSFIYRLNINGIYLAPTNDCPHASCTMPFVYPQGITVFRGMVEIGSLASAAPFELRFDFTKG